MQIRKRPYEKTRKMQEESSDCSLIQSDIIQLLIFFEISNFCIKQHCGGRRRRLASMVSGQGGRRRALEEEGCRHGFAAAVWRHRANAAALFEGALGEDRLDWRQSRHQPI